MPLAQTPAEKKKLSEVLSELKELMEAYARRYGKNERPTSTLVGSNIFKGLPHELMTSSECDELQQVLERWDEKRHRPTSNELALTLPVIEFCSRLIKELERPSNPRGRSRPQIRLSKDGTLVTIDGVAHQLTGADDAEFIRYLLRRRGSTIKASIVTAALQKRADRIYTQLPEAVRVHILKPKGKGSRTGYCIP